MGNEPKEVDAAARAFTKIKPGTALHHRLLCVRVGDDQWAEVCAGNEKTCSAAGVAIDQAIAIATEPLATENKKLRDAISLYNLQIMQTSGEWSLHDVTPEGQAESDRAMQVAIENVDLEHANTKLKAEVDQLKAERDGIILEVVAAASSVRICTPEKPRAADVRSICRSMRSELADRGKENKRLREACEAIIAASDRLVLNRAFDSDDEEFQPLMDAINAARAALTPDPGE